MKNVLMFGSIVLFGIVLSGCSDKVKQRIQQERHAQDIQTGVHLITLEDGTRCALFYQAGYRSKAGGISCDWK